MPLPSISYALNIPNPPNNPAIDVIDMQSNANAIDSIIRVDHVAFNAKNNSGCHNQSNYIITSSGSSPTPPPLPSLSDNAVTMYASKINEGGTFGNGAELFFLRQADDTNQIQLTGPGIPAFSGNFGITFIAGGFIVQWGKVFAGQTSSNRTDYLFSSTSPNIAFPNRCFQVQITLQQAIINGFSFGINNLSATGFSLNTLASSYGSGGGGATFNWFAIGN